MTTEHMQSVLRRRRFMHKEGTCLPSILLREGLSGKAHRGHFLDSKECE